MKLILDHSVPQPLRRPLPDHEVQTAEYPGWETLRNGELIRNAIQGGYDLLTTCDQSIRFQQNLLRQPITVLTITTNDWATIRTNISLVRRPERVRRGRTRLPAVVTHPPWSERQQLERNPAGDPAMTTTDQTLDKVAEIVRAELPKHLVFDESAIVGVQGRSFIGSDSEDFIDVNVILSDDYPQLDIPKVVDFIGVTKRVFQESGIDLLVAVSHSRSYEYA